MLEFPLVKKSGKDIWVSQKVSIIRDEERKITGYSGIIRDITFIKNVEIERTERQEKAVKYNKALRALTIKSYSNNEDFEIFLKTY
jgi:RNase P/RNase MRP subunit p29